MAVRRDLAEWHAVIVLRDGLLVTSDERYVLHDERSPCPLTDTTIGRILYVKVEINHHEENEMRTDRTCKAINRALGTCFGDWHYSGYDGEGSSYLQYHELEIRVSDHSHFDHYDRYGLNGCGQLEFWTHKQYKKEDIRNRVAKALIGLRRDRMVA